MTKKEISSAINLAENIGRLKLESLLEQLGIVDIEFTKKLMNRIDCFFKHNNTVVGAEIKNRSEKYENYDTYIMETSKLDYMRELISNKTASYCWMVYFFGNTCYIFGTKTIEALIKKGILKESMEKLPNSTVNKTRDVFKPTYLLPKEYAMKLEKTDVWRVVSEPKKVKD